MTFSEKNSWSRTRGELIEETRTGPVIEAKSDCTGPEPIQVVDGGLR